MIQLVQDYFDAFSAQNLEKLSELYSDTVILNEWNENVFVGKQQVLEANKKLFEQFKNIKIEVITSKTDKDYRVSLNEIKVKLDTESVKVVDIIRFYNNKITSITAYRGF